MRIIECCVIGAISSIRQIKMSHKNCPLSLFLARASLSATENYLTAACLVPLDHTSLSISAPGIIHSPIAASSSPSAPAPTSAPIRGQADSRPVLSIAFYMLFTLCSISIYTSMVVFMAVKEGISIWSRKAALKGAYELGLESRPDVASKAASICPQKAPQ